MIGWVESGVNDDFCWNAIKLGGERRGDVAPWSGLRDFDAILVIHTYAVAEAFRGREWGVSHLRTEDDRRVVNIAHSALWAGFGF